MRNQYRLKREFVRWLSSADLNVFATVTLKKMRYDDFGNRHWMDEFEADRTGEILKDRVVKSIRRSGIDGTKSLPFYTFYEVSLGDQRPHFHIAAKIPDVMNFDEYAEMFRATVGRLDWVYKQIDVRPITYRNGGSWQEVCNYGLKSGSSAFLPSASNVCQIN